MAFSFGAPSTNAPAPAAGAGFSFGGAAAPAPAPNATNNAPAPAGGGFSFGATAAAAGGGGAPAPAAAGGFGFGAPPSTANASAPAPAPGGGLFGAAAPAPSTTAAPATAAAPAAGGGFSFGGGASTTSASTSSTATTAPASNKREASAPVASEAGGGFNFGGVAKDATKDASATPAAKSGFAFGATTPGTTPAAKAPSPVKTPQTVGASTPAPAGGGLFGGTPATSAATTAGGATANTTSIPSANAAAQSATDKPQMIEPPPIEYQSLTIEQILNRFQSELESDAIAFLTEAQRVAHYDATLRDTQHSLSDLTNMVSRLMLHQTEVDTQLQGIGSYQKELTGTLDLLERNVDELFAAQSNINVEDADVERERSYERAIEVNNKLDQMNTVLTNVVSDLNAAQERVWSSSGSREEGKDEEVGKIIGVFNAHHETLAYLESKARAVEADMAMIGQVLANSGQ